MGHHAGPMSVRAQVANNHANISVQDVRIGVSMRGNVRIGGKEMHRLRALRPGSRAFRGALTGPMVRLRRGRHRPMHHQTHVTLIDPEAERGAYTIETRSLWGFDAQVASGKLRECAGCAPQGDTEVDTLCC